MKIKRIISRLLYLQLLLVAFILVLAAAGMGFLQTRTGKRILANRLSEILENELGPGSLIRNINGFIPFDIKADVIKFCDRRGMWLQINNFSIRISPAQIFQLKLRIDELSADQIFLNRFPVGETGIASVVNERQSEESNFPDGFPDLELSRLFIRELILGEELAGDRTSLKLNGAAKLTPGDEMNAFLKLTGLESPAFFASIDGSSSHDLDRFKLVLNLSDGARGFIPRMLGLPEVGPIKLQLKGEGPLDLIHTDLNLEVEKVGTIQGGIDLNFKNPGGEGDLAITINELDYLSQLFKVPLSGSFQSTLSLNRENGAQNLSLQTQTNDFTFDFFTISGMNISISLQDIFVSPSGDLLLSLHDFKYAEKEDGRSAGSQDINLQATFSGPANQPRVDFNLQAKGITYPTIPADNPGPVGFSIKAQIENNRIQAEAKLSGLEDVILYGDASGPAKLTLSPLSFSLPTDEKLEGTVRAGIDLNLLTKLAEISRQSLTGKFTADISSTGSIRKPEYSGKIKIENGEYQNLDLGTVLTELQMAMEINNSGGVIKQFTARGPRGGKLLLDGTIDISPDEYFPFSLALTLSSMELANTDEYWASISGKTTLSGNINAMEIMGRINIDNAGFRIPKSSSPSVVGIPVIEINKPGLPGPVRPSTPSTFLKNIDLDVTIKAEDQISVSGRGLSSSWGADISVMGTANAPVIKGGLKLSKGYFMFLGKRLDLINCSISFAGGVPPTLQMNINAQATSGGILINLQVVGSPDNPKLILTSQPSLPPDEILARLLFGASKASLTPMEGARIAYGLQVLQGGSDIFDYLTGWTSFLGAPQLNITQYANDPNVTAVSARWDLVEDVSVENQKSLTGSGDLVIFYLDLSRQFQVMTITGVSGAGDGARVRWHYDF